ncbi:MAG: trypsin-like peptidase domain-containing protein [Candidatus Nomurabacteria bacterium]|jgi:serine protease Do|nr:trypsin-like peptidase domain-containing protein [Candidatus Nomurabacteria bacterium]
MAQLNGSTKENHTSRRLAMVGAAVIIAAAVAGFGGAALHAQLFGGGTTTEMVSIKSEGDAIASVVDKVGPSVVSIMVSSKTQANDFFSMFYGGGATEQTTNSAGSGVIISRDGLVITNKHVIPDNTTSVKVVASDGREYDGVEVVGRDALNDIAFLKIPNVSDLTPATLGSSQDVTVGQKVVAIGNALGQYQNTVTSGIISGKARSITARTNGGQAETLSNLLQTDAAINPGNSGGPLVTFDGKVIGINTAIVENAQGLGFAIPIDEVQGVIDGVLATGKVERAYLGVRYIGLTDALAEQYKLPIKRGAYLGGISGSAIVKDSPADKAGLRTGDIITAVNDAPIDENHTLASLTAKFKPGDQVKLHVQRGDQSLDITVQMAKYE